MPQTLTRRTRNSTHSTVLRWLVRASGVAILLLTLAMLAISQWNWNSMRPWLEQRLGEATGHSIHIHGDLALDWHWPQPLEHSWRHWVPGVTIHAQDVRIDNPAGFAMMNKPTPQSLGTITHASASLRLLPLLQHRLILDSIVLTDADIALARSKDDVGNWIALPAQQSRWRIGMDQLVVSGGRVTYSDEANDLTMRLRLYPSRTSEAITLVDGTQAMRFSIQGLYQGQSFEGEGMAGSSLPLNDNAQTDYPLQLKARGGGLHVDVSGVLSQPMVLSGMDLQVALQGANMADLYPLTGLLMPSTPAFKTQGRLLGSLMPGSADWEYRDFDGVVGASDLHGSLIYTSAIPRPQLEGRILSKHLYLADLAPMTGQRPTTSDDARRQGSDRVLPDKPIDTSRWSGMDMDIAFSAETVARTHLLPIENLSTRIQLKDAKLALSPLRFGLAKGKVSADLEIDGHTGLPKAELRGHADGLQLSALFPGTEQMRLGAGQIGGSFMLTSRGKTIAHLFGASAGEIKISLHPDAFNDQLMELAAPRLGTTVAFTTQPPSQAKDVKPPCAVADFVVRDGLASTGVSNFSAERAPVDITGYIDLKNETLDLRIKPELLQRPFYAPRSPLNVKGHFIKPTINEESGGPMLLAGGKAIAATASGQFLQEDSSSCKSLLARLP